MCYQGCGPRIIPQPLPQIETNYSFFFLFKNLFLETNYSFLSFRGKLQTEKKKQELVRTNKAQDGGRSDFQQTISLIIHSV